MRERVPSRNKQDWDESSNLKKKEVILIRIKVETDKTEAQLGPQLKQLARIIL